MKNTQWIMKSPIGLLHLVASEKGLQGLHWKKQSAQLANGLTATDPATRFLAETVRQLEEYFVGKRKDFEIPLDVTGTPFQKSVWDQLRKIPYGKTASYSDVAARIKNEKAVRAVGTANGRNPVSIIVPCHRVIAADGTLGGYAGGLPTKQLLLALEKKT